MEEKSKKDFKLFYLLFAAAASLVVAPKLLMAAILTASCKAVTASQSSICFFCGYVLCAVSFGLAVRAGKDNVKTVKDLLLGGLCLLTVRYAFSLIHSILSLKRSSLSTGGIIADILLMVLEAVLFSYALFALIIMLRDEQGKIAMGKQFPLALKEIKEILLGAVSYGVLNFICGFLEDKFITGLGKSNTVIGFLTKLVLIAMLVFAAMSPVIFMMMKKADALTEAKERDKPAESKAFSTIELILAGALIAAIIIFSLIPKSMVPKRDELIKGSLSGGMQEAASFAEKRDYLMALKVLDKADALPLAWKAYLEGNPEEALKAYELDTRNSMTELLYMYTCIENEEKAGENLPNYTKALYSHEGDEVWCFGYLDMLSEKKNLSETEKTESKRIAMKLAAGNRFDCAAILPGELTKKEKERLLLEIEINTREDYVDTIEVWNLLALYVERNGVDWEVRDKMIELIKEYPGSPTVTDTLEMLITDCLASTSYSNRTYAKEIMYALFDAADENPDSFALNLLTIQTADNFMMNPYDEADTDTRNKLREKIGPVIDRFETLFEKELSADKELKEEEKKEARVSKTLDIAQVLTDMDLSEMLQEYLTKANATLSDERIDSMLGAVALKNSDYETALPILEKEYEAEKDDPQLNMILSILYYRKGEMEKSLEKAVSFTNIMISPGVLENEPELGTDFTALIATYITGDKAVADFEDGKHCAYIDFTDEQMKIVNKSELFAKTLDYEYRYQYQVSDYLRWDKVDEFRKLEEDVLKLTNDYPNLSTGYYLAGRILGYYIQDFWTDEEATKELKDTDKAIEMYKKCLSFEDNQPAVWYSLALTLDNEKRYDEALDAVQKALDHMYYDSWYASHGNEYHGWGILYHANGLRASIRYKMANGF